MKNIFRTVAGYTAIGTLALLMGTAVVGCERDTVQGPAGAPGAAGANGAPGVQGSQGEAAPANPAMSEKSEKTTTTTSSNDVPGTGSSTTTEKSSTKSTN